MLSRSNLWILLEYRREKNKIKLGGSTQFFKEEIVTQSPRIRKELKIDKADRLIEGNDTRLFKQ